MSPHETTCRRLQFTWGVHPEHVPERPKNWNIWVRDWLKAHGISGSVALLTEGPSADNPSANNRMEVIELGRIGA
jgi:pyruvate kinase